VYERFTDRARRAVLLAQEEAQLMQRDLVGTEHVLLGLIAEGGGIAATALESLGISLQAARAQAREEGAPVANRSSRTPRFSPTAVQLLDRARQEASELEQSFIGTEHLLLSLLRDEDGAAARVLEQLGKDLSAIRDEVLDLVDTNHESEGRTGVETADLDADEEGERGRHLLRQAIPVVAVAVILAGGTAIARRRGYLIGRNLVVRCRQGHLFTTIWLPGASLKSIRLGWARIQRCPVGKHWTVVTPVREDDLSDDERQNARATRDIRIP
jgi:ATP-dependent Clp protease ATP-binding subunit ClpA